MAITAVFSCAEAHGTFTWFGLRKDNTEIFINTGTDDKIHPPAHKPHPKNPSISLNTNQNQNMNLQKKNKSIVGIFGGANKYFPIIPSRDLAND